MPLYELSANAITPVDRSTFADLGVLERSHLQRLLRDAIDVIAPDTLIITEEFGEWLDSSRRIDLLGIDRSANLVVIELKRTDDGGHMELQALRYSAMISAMTFGKLVEVHQRYLEKCGRTEVNAERRVLDFLGWESPQEETFADDVKIVLASADFSKELTTTVMWLNERDLDIRCVRLHPYRLGERILLDVQQIIPLPEATEYQVRLREKATERRQSRRKWDEPSFFLELAKRSPVADVESARTLLDWARRSGMRIWWGEGATLASFHVIANHHGEDHQLFGVYSGIAALAASKSNSSI